MARPLRIEFEGALYHVMARGNARVAQRFDRRLWAWCLMGNHYRRLHAET